MLLRKKNIVIYGAAGSIGSTVARIFAREGAQLFLAGRTLSKLDALAKEISAAGGTASAAAVDALDERAIYKHLTDVKNKSGTLDILFNAISMEDIQGPPLTTISFEDFFRPIQKAAKSQFLTARSAARIMAEQRSGVLMTITAGPPEASANIGGFGPACHVIEGIWRGLAAELGEFGVRAVCLRSAGSPDTADFQEMVRQHVEDSGQSREEFLAGLGSGTLLGRLPLVKEIGEVAAMMASDRASALTNLFVSVTCGFRAD
jgi:3-oxoacyl-[acyl-carrier protein] reductase